MDQEQTLCIACGLCCDGSLFSWVKLRPAEMAPARAAGLSVYGNEPADRGFAQPCACFSDRCSIYTSAAYPKACGAYRCALLNRSSKGEITYQNALDHIFAFKNICKDVHSALPQGSGNLRDKVVAYVEGSAHRDPRVDRAVWDYADKARDWFGVKDISPVFEPGNKTP